MGSSNDEHLWSSNFFAHHIFGCRVYVTPVVFFNHLQTCILKLAGEMFLQHRKYCVVAIEDSYGAVNNVSNNYVNMKQQ